MTPERPAAKRLELKQYEVRQSIDERWRVFVSPGVLYGNAHDTEEQAVTSAKRLLGRGSERV